MLRMRPLAGTGCAWFAWLTLGSGPAWSQQEEPANASAAAQEESKASAWLHGVFYREMSAYNFYLDAQKKQKLVMRREPLLRYPAPPEHCWGEIYV
jgi:hypothetical protein